MTREERLRVHLDRFIFEDLPEGTRLTGAQSEALCDAATVQQKMRAYERALVHSPLVLPEERTSFEFTLTYALPADKPDPEAYVDALYEAGCNDALLGIGRDGMIALDFTREAPDEQIAIESARAAVEQTIPGCRLLHVTKNDQDRG